MKKEAFLVIFLIISLTILALYSALAITGDTVTGEVSAQQTDVSIFILGTIPSLEIKKPDNQTYTFNESLLLEYEVSNAIAVWYNLDNGENTTITSFTYAYFNTSEGSHTLWLYANSSTSNITSANITFAINSAMFTINYSEWESLGMNYTNFNEYSYEEMENMQEFYLEHGDFGKFFFEQSINLTDDENPDDGQIEIYKHMNVSFNRIFLNSSALPNFNITATLWIYNLTLDNPRIAKDGEVCPASICTTNSYLNGVLSFNVTGFSVYEAEETPSGSSGGSGGGGGGGTSLPDRDLSIDKNEIKITVKQGETQKEKITITNKGIQSLSITLISEKIKDFIKISEETFNLNSGESKNVVVDFLAGDDVAIDVYIGKIIVQSGSIKKEIAVSIEVESKRALFDVKIEIPEKFLKVSPGSEIISEIKLFSLGKTGRVDVKLNYEIKDEEGNVILSSEETKAVETETSFLQTFNIPENTKSGKYMVYVKVTYNGEVASATYWVEIGRKTYSALEYIFFAFVILIIIFILIVMIELRKIKKHLKIDEKTLVKHKLIKRR